MTQALPKDVPQTLRRWKRYPAYKDSGIESLGEIPKHWEAKRLRFIICNGTQNGLYKSKDYYDDEGTPIISMSEAFASPVINVLAKDRVQLTQAEYRSYLLEKGDLLFARRSLVFEGSGKCSMVNELPEAHIFESSIIRVRPDRSVIEPFFALLFLNSVAGRFQILRITKQVTISGIDSPNLKDILIPLPPQNERFAIASFLDRETAIIDALIAKKERLIELLQEKRTAIISHAVTKGLDPTAPLKDSGVEWLGEVPAHWKTKRVKHCLKSIEQGWSPSCENRIAEDDEWGVLKVGCVNGAEFNPDENKALPADLEPRPELEIKPGDVLMSRANTRELLGSTSVIKSVRPRLLLCDKLYRLKVNVSVVNSDYLVLSLGSTVARFQMERDATGASSSMQNIGQDSVQNFVLSLPDLVEQAAIASYLDRETAKIDALIAKIREGIEKLKEYRTALISAAVTGKIDVRNEVTS
jgi:type I restriction enzyme S subunit